MDTLTGALIGFLSAVFTALLGFLLYRRDKYKEFVYQRKISAYEEMGGLLAELMWALIKAHFVIGKDDRKALKEILEENDVCGRVLRLYLFCYEKCLLLSEDVFRNVLLLSLFCHREEFHEDPEAFFGSVKEVVHDLIQVMRKDTGVSELSEGILKEIKKFP